MENGGSLYGTANYSVREETNILHEPEIAEEEDEPTAAHQPLYVVLLPSLAFTGVQLAWGVQVSRYHLDSRASAKERI